MSPTLSEARQAQLTALAQLIVSPIGVNVVPGQVVGLTAEPGMEDIWRAVAEAAYVAGAQFVDPWIFDPHVKHARLAHASAESLAYRPRWWGERYKAIGALGGAQIRLSGPVAPALMDDIPAERLGHDMMPDLPEALEVIHARLWNWIVAPGPSAGWAAALYPDLGAAAAVARLWEEIAFIMRLDESDPAAAWRRRFAQLRRVAAAMNEARYDLLHFEGPGTDLRVGLLPGSRFKSVGADETVAGVRFSANLPSEEIFSAPDPARVDGHVTATKPLVVGGGTVRGLVVRFAAGRAVSVTAESGAALVATMIEKDAGAARLGEVALVDSDSRVGQLDTVFCDTLLDENSASHLALGAAYPDTVEGAPSLERINHSTVHVDFMIGSPEVDVTGLRADGTRVALLRRGAWQI